MSRHALRVFRLIKGGGSNIKTATVFQCLGNGRAGLRFVSQYRSVCNSGTEYSTRVYPDGKYFVTLSGKK
jgi:hypothetical protein